MNVHGLLGTAGAGATGHADSARPAVRLADAALRRDELWAAATAVADEVAGAAVVAVHGSASLRTVVGIVGCLLAGVPVVPVPADAGPRERAHILADSRAELWLGDPPANGDRLDEGSRALTVVPIDPARRSDTSYPEPDPSTTAMIMYTSGTTGAPKGVVISRRAIASCLDGLANAWAWTADDVLVHGLPLFHVHGLVLGVLGALRVGSPLVHTGRPRPAEYATAAERHGGSLFFGVPTVWSRMCDEPAAAASLGQARLLVSGSAPLPVPVAERLRGLTGLVPVERYGMTESLITVAVRSDGERRPGWVGLSLPGVETRLRPLPDASDTPAATSPAADKDVPWDGESVGELQVRGGSLFDGYLGLAEVTAASWTPDGWFRTGDAAVIDPAGWHRIVGRTSVDLIKSGGYRIGAGEVEAALLAHPTIVEAAVVGVPDPDLGQRIVAYVVGDGTTPVDPATVADFVATQLSVHKRPREVRVVEDLPRNAMGKVQKKLLTRS
ncbi:acyl-CoA synthetase [Frankia inefficax]|uniref:AMP-dependent synthetase and ligase n=1 Tax=Pseudofrankia inefficax (strain DSM 45817 / CECT 9037 / DDB 130130 / EuI1c) TaxID=298654 RepID=E3J761_PSEI1|nr:AMP-dependent synthetase and ligase [Pseudofrankia inefficax]